MFRILAYSLPSLPLASLYFAIYVLLGEFYSRQFDLSLSAIGLSFILVRLFDAFSDPVMGYLSDKFSTPFGKRRPWVLLGGGIFTYAAWMLLVPNQGTEVGIHYFVFWLVISTIGWTIAYSPYYALGAELSNDYMERSRITFSRELLALLGIIIASLLYSIGYDLASGKLFFGITPSSGLYQISLASFLFFCFSMIFFLPSAFKNNDTVLKVTQDFQFREIFEVIGNQRLFVRLLVSHFLNGLANGFPPALFVFYVGYILGLPAYTGPLLLLYFIGAIIGVPFWLFLSKRIDKHRVWCGAMIYACIVFVFVLVLDKGDLKGFVIICLLSGLALSADLALPTSIQADVLDLEVLRTGKRPSGQFFALWGLISKSAVAISTGAALIILDLIGFQPNPNNEKIVLNSLSFMYGGIPILLKLISVYLMWDFELGRNKHKEVISSLRLEGKI